MICKYCRDKADNELSEIWQDQDRYYKAVKDGWSHDPAGCRDGAPGPEGYGAGRWCNCQHQLPLKEYVEMP